MRYFGFLISAQYKINGIVVTNDVSYLSISIGIDCSLFLVFLIWYKLIYDVNITKVFIAFYYRYGYKFVWCIGIISGAISQQ